MEHLKTCFSIFYRVVAGFWFIWIFCRELFLLEHAFFFWTKLPQIYSNFLITIASPVNRLSSREKWAIRWLIWRSRFIKMISRIILVIYFGTFPYKTNYSWHICLLRISWASIFLKSMYRDMIMVIHFSKWLSGCCYSGLKAIRIEFAVLWTYYLISVWRRCS